MGVGDKKGLSVIGMIIGLVVHKEYETTSGDSEC